LGDNETEPESKLARRGLLILGIAAAVVGVLALINWYVYANHGTVSYSSKSGSSNTSAVSSTREVLYEVEGTATSADITYETPSGTAQASNKRVPLGNKESGKPGIALTMERDDFVYISAQNQGSSGTVTCKITVDGVLISTVTSSGAYAIASCKGTAS
jgi:cytoskeletal protein RodZ